MLLFLLRVSMESIFDILDQNIVEMGFIFDPVLTEYADRFKSKLKSIDRMAKTPAQYVELLYQTVEVFMPLKGTTLEQFDSFVFMSIWSGAIFWCSVVAFIPNSLLISTLKLLH